MLEIGTKGYAEQVVEEAMTADRVGSGSAHVLATPEVVALAERACFESVQTAIGEGMTTVGSHLNIAHVAPTPVGVRVWCDSVLTAIEGRRLRFEVRVCDESGEVATGTHERYVVDTTQFHAKAKRRRKR